jgi:dolichol-phosphate mannosyltransferase
MEPSLKTDDELVAVVIPCYNVRKHILGVISAIGTEVWRIYVVDDHCPENSGDFVENNCSDPRVRVLRHQTNLGVGGAVKSGYKQALSDGAQIIVKIDGDGQMNPALIPELIMPIMNGEADYCKGNRFFNLESLLIMPKVRLFGNSFLSLTNKMVNGYWNIADPTNGFTAIHAAPCKVIPLDKIDNGFFFESDMLFRLSIIRAVVRDYPMTAVYNQEKSNLKIRRILFSFLFKYINRFLKRIFYNYLLRDFNAGSLQLFFGIVFSLFGLIFGLYHWILSFESRILATSGTVMIAAIPSILGFQLLLGALNYDVQNIPNAPLQNIPRLNKGAKP